jgi:LmbE family N-acetylglucosaminyl deacetylase
LKEGIAMNVLAVFSHPDDIELMCAGTLLKYKKSGHKIYIVMVTSGNQGSNLFDSREAIAAAREKEMLEAAKYYDAPVRFLRFNDQRWFDGEKERTAVLDGMRWANPDVIFTNNPKDPSVDHATTGQMVSDLMLSLPGKLLPASVPPISKVPTLFFCDSGISCGFVPEVYVDITDEFEEKQKAWMCHQTQSQWMQHFGMSESSFIEMPGIIGRFYGLQCGVRYAESFRVFRIHGYMPDFKLLP